MTELNYWAILVGAVLSMPLGALWYGPMFGKKWMEIVGATDLDMEARQKMQKEATKLYVIQFLLTLFQVGVLAYFVTNTVGVGELDGSLWIWVAFIMPTVAGASMWNNDARGITWARFLIQGGYQLVLFVMFGLLLQYWQ